MGIESSIDRGRETVKKVKEGVDSAREAHDAIDENKKKVEGFVDRHQKEVDAAKKGLKAVGVNPERLQVQGLTDALQLGVMDLIDHKNLVIDEGNGRKEKTVKRLDKLSISAGTDDGAANIEASVDRDGVHAKGAIQQGGFKAQAQVDNRNFQAQASLDKGPLSADISTNGKKIEGSAQFSQGGVSADIKVDQQGARGKANIKKGPLTSQLEADQSGIKGRAKIKGERYEVSGQVDSKNLDKAGVHVEVTPLDNQRVKLTLTAEVSAQEGATAGAKFNVRRLPITAIVNVSKMKDPNEMVFRAAAGLNLGENVHITVSTNLQAGNQSASLNVQGKFGGRGQKR